MRWVYPQLLLFLLVVPVLAWWEHRRRQDPHRDLPFSSLTQLLTSSRGVWKQASRWVTAAYLLIVGLVVLGMARPQQLMDRWPVWDRGVDVVLVLDLSESMKHPDLKPNRMAVAKKLLQTLLAAQRQRNDRFGLVIFADKAYTLCPLTIDHKMLSTMLDHVDAGQIGDKTAIGDALATALARLRHAPRRKRSIVLLTDGENNAGRVHPFRAAQRARTMGIPIYTVLIGKQIPASSAPPLRQPGQPSALPQTPWGALQRISRLSGGQGYRLTTTNALSLQLQQLLKKMTPQRAQKPRYFNVYHERFQWFLWPAIGLLGLMLWLQLTRFRSIP